MKHTQIDPHYKCLFDELMGCYEQAAVGKGHQRHGTGLPFDQQPMQTIADLNGSWDGMAYQAIKKIQESTRLPTSEARARELRGAVNYICGMLIWQERHDGQTHTPSRFAVPGMFFDIATEGPGAQPPAAGISLDGCTCDTCLDKQEPTDA